MLSSVLYSFLSHSLLIFPLVGSTVWFNKLVSDHFTCYSYFRKISKANAQRKSKNKATSRGNRMSIQKHKRVRSTEDPG
jgi:hypothetical protein